MFGLDLWGVHSICSASGTFRLVFYLFIYFSCGVACSIYGALGWNLCGSHSVCSAHEAFGLVCFHGAFRVPGALGGGALVAFTALVLFGKCWGWMFCGFQSSCGIRAGPPLFCGVQSVGSVNGTLWRDPCGVYSVSSAYGSLGLNVSCGVYCVFLLLMEGLGWTLVKFTACVAFMRRWGWECL